MRTCPNCGASVADTDDFCGNCGTYLGWLHPEPGPAVGVPSEKAAEPVVDQPRAVAPARPVARRPRTGAPAVETTSNGPPCEVCGTANPREARFCRRCAAPLTEVAPVPVSRRRFRLPGWPWFGGSGSPWPRRVVLLVVLGALVAAGFLLYPFASVVIEDARDKLSTPEVIVPARTVASARLPGHPGTAAVDGATNRYWGTPAVGGSAEFRFADPFRLLGVVIHTGASAERDVFDQQARPSTLDLEVTNSQGVTTTIRVDLADRPGPQRTDTAISDVVSVRLVVRAAAGLRQGRHIALGEIEFFRRP
jgi:hypothetical protein